MWGANKQYELHYLSEKFYQKYNVTNYPEIEKKGSRPYIVLLFQIKNNTFALPFRTNIRHTNCYKFRQTSRNTDSATGIDFSKAVIINDEEYIGDFATIDEKEYVELNDRFFFIQKKFQTYLEGYCKFANGKGNEYQSRKYIFTTLKYFHDELGI